jgi:tetratricopeptide (TPR) repeat protein
MRKALFILLVLVFASLYYLGLLSQRETLPFSKEFFATESFSPTERVWELEKTLPLSNETVDRLYQLKLDRGMRNLPIFSYLLMRHAKEAIQKGQTDRAVELADASIKFSPDLPQPYFALAQTLWHQDHSQLDKIFSAFFKGGTAQFRHYPSSVRLFYGVYYILSNAILLTFMIFGVVVIIKYLPLYFHTIRKTLIQEMSGMVMSGVKILLLLVPFFLRLDLLWAILFWSILLWGYEAKREKQLIALFLILLVYLPFFLRSSSSFLNGPSSDVIFNLYQVNHEDWDRVTEEKLQTWLLNHPNDTEVLFSLGLMDQRQGHYPQAEEFYKKTIQKEPKFSEAFSNLGNVYLAQKQIPLSVATYEQAIHLNPMKGAYYFNLYRAYSQETFFSGKTDQVYQKARQLDPQLIDSYSKSDSPHVNRLVIDEVLTTGRLWRRFLTHLFGGEGFLFWLFNGWFEKVPSRIPLLVPVVFVGFLIGVSSYAQTKRFLTRCPMCGTSTFRLYSGNSEREFVCFNCYRIFIQKEKLHPRITEKKFLQVRQFQEQNQLVARFISFFFVGFGYLWKERFARGSLLVILFFIFVLRFIYWNGVIPDPIAQPLAYHWDAFFWGGLFILFYFFSLWRIYRLKMETERSDEIRPQQNVRPGHTIPENEKEVS